IAKSPKSGKGPGATFTVRKISSGIGVERVFALNSPFVEKIEVESSSEVRRSRLYYLRELTGKKARLKEAENNQDSGRASAAATKISADGASTEESPKSE